MSNPRKLLQLIKDNARPKGSPPAIRSEAAADGPVHIYVHDVIDPWWGANAADLIKALAGATGRDVLLHINSPGGDVFESLAMASAIAAHDGKVTALIDGMAASAATRLALACAEVQMVDGGLFMIHNAWTMAWGNANELRDTATLLDKVDSGIVGDYQRKTGATAEKVTEWMAAETWFTAAEAKDAGFVDEVLTASQAAPANAAWNLAAYRNAPKPPAPSAPDAAAIAAQAGRTQRLNRSRLAALLLTEP